MAGFNNASTNDDFTNYFETVPANHLERVLWAEAQRMGSLVIDEANFKSERDVVKEEFRQSVLSSPYGKLFYLYLPQTFYDVSPYGRSVIGSIKDLDSATVEDVRQFHAAYYRPDNAVLVVSGQFRPEAVRWLGRQVFRADRPSPTARWTAPRWWRPVRAAPKEVTVYEANVPLPAVSISYASPDARSADYPAWVMMDAILSRGQSSRLYQSLVYDKKLATQVMTFQGDNETPGVYSLIAILSQGKSADEGLAALKVEIAKMRDGEVSAAELDEARNELITATLRGRETSNGRAGEMANNVVLRGDPKAGDAMLARLQTISAADIQALAKKLFNDAGSVTIRYLPEGLKTKDAKADTITPSAKTEAKAISIPAAEIATFALAPEDKRQKPPEAGKPIAAVIPGAQEKTLANGLRVIVANKPGLPLVSANLRIGGGGALDPAGKYGLASMTADLAQRGTATRSAVEISRQIESLGADLGAGADADGTSVSISTRSDKAKDVFAIMADVVQHPAFKQEELDRAKSEALDGLKVQLASPRGIGGKAMSRLLFGDGAYGHVSTPKSIGAIAQTDIADFAKAHWGPEGSILVITGDVTAGRRLQAGGRRLRRMAESRDGRSERRRSATDRHMAPRAVIVDMPKMGQTYVGDGPAWPGAEGCRLHSHPAGDRSARRRLFGAGSTRKSASSAASPTAPAPISARGSSAPPLVAAAQTRNDAASQVVKLMGEEITKIATQPIPAAELDARKAVLIGGFGRSVETTAGLAGELGELAQFGLPLSNLQSYSRPTLRQ